MSAESIPSNGNPIKPYSIVWKQTKWERNIAMETTDIDYFQAKVLRHN